MAFQSMRLNQATFEVEALEGQLDGSLDIAGALSLTSDIRLNPSGISTAHIITTGSLRVRCTDGLWIGDDGADAVRIGRTNTALAPIYLRSGGEHDLVVSDSKVGIGVENPSVSLEIDGDIKFSPTAISTAHVTSSGSLTVRADSNIIIGDSTVDSIKVGRTNTAVVPIHLRSGGANDLVVKGSKVGIGTDSPDEILHLKSSTQYKPELLIENTNDDQFSGVLRFYKSTTDEAASDQTGLIIWTAKDGAGADANTAWIVGKMASPDAGAEEGSMHLGVASGGSASYSTLSLVGSGTEHQSYFLIGDPPQSASSTKTGINTSVPAKLLDINARGSADGIQLTWDDADGSAADYATITIEDTNGKLKIATVDGDGAAGHIALMPDGNVGINDTSPSHTLDVDGDINLTGGFSFDDGTAVTSIDTDISSVSGSDDSLASAKAIKTYVDSVATAADLDFQGDSGGALSIDLDSETLTIAGTSNEVETVGSGNTLTIGLPNDVTIGSDLTVTDSLVVDTSTLVVNASGSADKVGINKAAPHLPLHVVKTATSGAGAYANTPCMILEDATRPGLQIVGNAGNIGIVQFGDNVSSNSGEIYYDHGADTFSFRTAGSVVMTLDSGGKLGVGTTGPSVDLDIHDTTTSSATQGGNLRLASNDGAAMASGHRLGVLEFAGAEDASNTITVGARIEALCDAGWSASENGADLLFYTTNGNASQSEKMRITADGEVVLPTTTKLSFHDETGGENIVASSDGHLEVNAGTTLDMTAPTVDINASTAMTIDTPGLTVTDATTSSATEGGSIRLVSNDGAAMADDHRLGVLEFAGAEDGSNTITVGAKIEAICDAGWSASENGAALVMSTTDGNASQSEVLRLDSDKLATFAGDVNIAGSLKVADSSATSRRLTFKSTDTATMSSDRELIFDVRDADRTIQIGGDLTIAGDFIRSGAHSCTLTTSGTTSITLPTTGTVDNTADARKGRLIARTTASGTSLSNSSSAALLDSVSVSADTVASGDRIRINTQMKITATGTPTFSAAMYISDANPASDLAAAISAGSRLMTWPSSGTWTLSATATGAAFGSADIFIETAGASPVMSWSAQGMGSAGTGATGAGFGFDAATVPTNATWYVFTVGDFGTAHASNTATSFGLSVSHLSA